MGDPQGAALALMANTLVHLLDALGLLEDATAAEGASAAESIASALGAAGLPTPPGGPAAAPTDIRALADAQPPAIVQAARRLAQECDV